jgi:hypothetical protein
MFRTEKKLRAYFKGRKIILERIKQVIGWSTRWIFKEASHIILVSMTLRNKGV